MHPHPKLSGSRKQVSIFLQKKHMTLSQNMVPPSHFENFLYVLQKSPWGDGSKPWYLVNPKIAGKWMFIPLKMYLYIGIDPYPWHFRDFLGSTWHQWDHHPQVIRFPHGTKVSSSTAARPSVACALEMVVGDMAILGGENDGKMVTYGDGSRPWYPCSSHQNSW
jgi:hypothetical protein